MKKIQLKFAAQKMTKEQMKKIGGGEPTCNVTADCGFYFDVDFILGVCQETSGGCLCVGYDEGYLFAGPDDQDCLPNS